MFVYWPLFFLGIIISHVSSELNLQEVQQYLQSRNNTLTQKKSIIRNRLVDTYERKNAIDYFLNEFINNTYHSLIGDEPVFIYDMDFHVSQFGNRLGNYYEAVSIADELGMHFIGFLHYLDESVYNDTMVFISTLPTIIRHPNPHHRDAIVDYLKSDYGKRLRVPWPWREYNRLWLNKLQFIKDTLKRCVQSYLENVYGVNGPFHIPTNTFANYDVPSINVNPSTNASNNSSDVSLPPPVPVPFRRLIPDAVILFRCADILLFGNHGYGFLNFNTYLMIIPSEVESIYVVSEPLEYGTHHEKFRQTVCQEVGFSLIGFLRYHYPTADVQMRRGYAFDSFTMMSYANYVICSPSTFCFFGSYANTNGDVYYKTSQLINNGTKANIYAGRANMHWMDYPKLVQFYHNSTYTSQYMTRVLSSRTTPVVPDY